MNIHISLLLTLCTSLASACRTVDNDSESKGLLGKTQIKKEICAETGKPQPGTTYALTVFPNLDEEWPKCDTAEKAEFADFETKIHALQTQLADSNRKFNFRGFHAKSHGCMYGFLNVNDPATRNTIGKYQDLRKFADAKEPTKYGLFSEPKKYEVYLRFSNAQGKFQNDRSPDGKGIAIKIMNAGRTMSGSQDFTMSNTPICNAATAAEFMVLGHSLASGLGETAKLLTKPVERKAIIGTLSSGASWKPSVATETYWTRTAYKMGPYAAKYFVQPVACSGESTSDHQKPKLSFQALQEYMKYQSDLTKMEDYYRDELAARNTKGDICFDFMVQFQTDPQNTPVENPTVLWDNTMSPPVKVAQIVIPKNQQFNSTTANQFCEKLGFSPENFLEEHRPMGHMNRARLSVYHSSRVFRQKQYGTPPEPKSISQLKK